MEGVIVQIFADIGNAAMAAKMLQLDVEQTASAMSLAASQAAGMARQTGTGAHLIESGFAGRNGICAATLAKRGYTGNRTIFEGPAGEPERFIVSTCTYSIPQKTPSCILCFLDRHK